MKVTFASFFAVVLTLAVTYILQPLNAGAIAVVFFISLATGAFIVYIYQRFKKKK